MVRLNGKVIVGIVIGIVIVIGIGITFSSEDVVTPQIQDESITEDTMIDTESSTDDGGKEFTLSLNDAIKTKSP